MIETKQNKGIRFNFEWERIKEIILASLISFQIIYTQLIILTLNYPLQALKFEFQKFRILEILNFQTWVSDQTVQICRLNSVLDEHICQLVPFPGH